METVITKDNWDEVTRAINEFFEPDEETRYHFLFSGAKSHDITVTEGTRVVIKENTLVLDGVRVSREIIS